MNFALIGMPLGHSYSEKIHRLFGKYDYTLLECAESSLSAVLKDDRFDGFNVTIPHKLAAAKICDHLSPEAEAIGSVNTVLRRGGELWGCNTDCAGFMRAVLDAGIEIGNRKCAVFGTGGSSRAVGYALKKLGSRETVFVSRSGDVNYSSRRGYDDAEVLINCTPVGMYPKGGLIAEVGDFPKCEAVFDLVYNPPRSELMLSAKKAGVKYAGGLGMLVAQAAEACRIFCGDEVSPDREKEVLREIRKDTENIILIGMPGCGKTSIGRAVSEKLSMPFIDTDGIIEEKLHAKCDEIIEKYGIEKFREFERDAAAGLSDIRGAVIATGGGTGLYAGSRDMLSSGGRVFLIERDLSSLPRERRPLSRDIGALYAERRDMYASWADEKINNSGTVDSAAEEIAQKAFR